jgi:outer membrane cobalamin receptor
MQKCAFHLWAAVALCAFTALPQSLCAADSAAGSATGTVEISAPRPGASPAPTAGRSSLDSAAIAASGATTVSGLLASLPGLSISANGASGAQTAVSIRGSTTNQVLVLVDGVPVSDPSTGLADLSRLGLFPGDIDSIEVVKGGASAQYGPSAVGGVVLIRTKSAQRVKSAILELSIANLSRLPFRSQSGSGLGAVAFAPSALSLADGQDASIKLSLPFGLAIGASGQRAANAYGYSDYSGVRRSRSNAGLLAGQAGLSWRGTAIGGTASISANGELRDLGVPGSVGALTATAEQKDSNLRASLGYSTDSFLSDRVSFTSSAYGLLSSTTYWASSGSAPDENDATHLGLDPRWSILAAPWLDLGMGFSLRHEGLDSTNVTNASGGRPERMTAGCYIEPRLSLGSWTISPAARVDWTSDFASGPSFSLGLARSFPPSLVASANVSSAYRAPSFDDLYWPAVAGVEGNPSLVPESSIGGDLGFSYESETTVLSASAYARYVRNVILWQPGDDGIWRPSNYGAGFYPGIEAEASVSASRFVRVKCSYTFIHSFLLSGDADLSDDLRVPMVPEHAFDLAFVYERDKVQGRVELDYAGLRYYGVANVEYSPAHLVVDAHIKIATTTISSIALDAENLLDERYESVKGYPMPGFSLRLCYSLRLSR